MQFLLILLVVLGGMGLSVEAGLLGPLGQEVGKLWASLSVFGVGSVLTFLLMLFFSPRNSPSVFAQPGWTLTGGILGAAWLVVLVMVVPVIGIAMTMVAVLAGQVFKSMVIDHFGWFGMSARKIDRRRLIALGLIMLALIFIMMGDA